MCGQCAVGKAYLSLSNSALRKHSRIDRTAPKLKIHGTYTRPKGKPHSFSREECMTEQGGLQTLPRYTGKLRLSWTFHPFHRPLATATMKVHELHHHLGAPLFQSAPTATKLPVPPWDSPPSAAEDNQSLPSEGERDDLCMVNRFTAVIHYLSSLLPGPSVSDSRCSSYAIDITI